MPTGVYKRSPEHLDKIKYPAPRKAAKNLAKGIKQGNLVIGNFALDPDIWKEVRARAIRDNTSFSEQLRLLIEWGLECTNDH